MKNFKSKCTYFLLFSLISKIAVAMKSSEWEITSFEKFKNSYLQKTKTYPEVFEETCLDKKQNADKIFSENIKNTYADQKPIVSFNELNHAIQDACVKIGNEVSEGSWVNRDYLSKDFFTQLPAKEKIDLTNKEHIKYFAAYEKKLLLDDTKGEKAVFLGDLHGGCKTLIKVLEDYISPDSFKLKKEEENTHLVFCGDFVDSGKDGAEVLYLLARIAGQNNKNVHLVRGNHEDAQFNRQQLFFQELAYKYGKVNPKETFFYNKYELDDAQYNAVTRLYDIMPLALFIGNRRYRFGGYDWRLVCHGGYEVGDVNISDLLAHSSKVAYKLIGEKIDFYPYRSIIRRATVWAEILKNHQLHIDEKLIEDKSLKLTFEETCKDFIPLSPGCGVEVSSKNSFNRHNNSNQLSMGYCWSIFDENKDSHDLSYTPILNAWVFGQDLSKILLQRSSTWRNRLLGMIRAHQHVASPKEYTTYPLMEHIIKNKGLWTLWESKQNPVAYNGVTTLGVAPDTTYGISQETTQENEKHYPGVVEYATLTLEPKTEWLQVSMNSKTKTYDNILPETYKNKHKVLLGLNAKKKLEVKDQQQSKLSKKSRFCTIL